MSNNCSGYNTRKNDMPYQYTMYNGAYQNKNPFVSYQDSAAATRTSPVAIPKDKPLIEVSSMLKGYYGSPEGNPLASSPDPSAPPQEQLNRAYSKGGCIKPTAKNKYLDTNECNLEANGSCVNPGNPGEDVGCQSNVDVLPGSGSLMVAESSRNLQPLTQFRGLTIDRWDSWRTNEQLKDTNMYTVTSTRLDAKKELEELAQFKKAMKKNLEQKKASVMKRKLQENQKALQKEIDEKVRHFKQNAMSQTKQQEAYYRSVVQAKVAQEIEKEKRKIEQKVQQVKEKNMQILKEKARQKMREGEQQIQQINAIAESKAASNVASYRNSNLIHGQKQIQELNSQLSQDLDYKIDDILFSEFDAEETRLRDGLAFNYESVANMQMQEEKQMYPYGHAMYNNAINNY